MDFQATEDVPLQAALATAFADSPILSPRPSVSASTSISHSAAPDPPTEAEAEGGGDESWKEEYDQLVTGWRAESAAAREKAEQERERWRAIREQEAEQEKHVEAGRKDPEWETVTGSLSMGGPKAGFAPKLAEEGGRTLSAAKAAASSIHDTPPRRGSPSLSDARDLVTGETPRRHEVDTIESLLPRFEPPSIEYTTSRRDASTATTPPSNADEHGLSNSRTWEEVPSLDSSFPSLSFPDRSTAVSPEPRGRPSYQQPPAPPSVTLAIFDSSLSCRTRALAFTSSLAINMLLPFVNGVMLGFGEIFAKNVVSFFGWKIPGTAVGIRAASRRK